MPRRAASGRSCFRMCATDAVIGRLLAEFARDRSERAARVAMLYEVGRTYSARLAEAFTAGFADPAAGSVVLRVHYSRLETTSARSCGRSGVPA